METKNASPVLFTASAIAEIRQLMAAPGFDTSLMLRVGVKGGGCSGFSYLLGFDQRIEGDMVYEFEGLQYLMNPSHGLYLSGMQIDWEDGLNARGFSFENPNASKSCGCGSSFAV